jgi:hypothetical protein
MTSVFFTRKETSTEMLKKKPHYKKLLLKCWAGQKLCGCSVLRKSVYCEKKLNSVALYHLNGLNE